MQIKGHPTVYVVSEESRPLPTTMYAFPRQDIPDQPLNKNDQEYKSPQWFLQNIRYISQQYNSINSFRGPALINGQQIQGNQNANATSFGYVTEMVENILYYFGWQNNLDYAYLTKDITTSNLQAPWIKNQDIAKLVDYVVGNIRRQMNDAVWSATPVNDGTQTSRDKIYGQLMTILAFQPIYDEMEKQGVYIQPAGPKAPRFKTKYEISDFLDKNYNEYSAELDEKIAIATWVDDRWFESVGLAAKFLLCTGWACGEHIVKNGNYTFEIFPPYQGIFDLRKDSDFGRYDQFAARAFYMTPTEIFSEYPELSEEQRTEINNMASNNTIGGQWNSSRGVLWWGYAPVGTVGVVRAYWDTNREERVKTVNGKLVGVPAGEMGEYFITDICKGTLIGNRFMLRYGYEDRIVEDKANPADLRKPISRFIPNMMTGSWRSFVGRLKFLSNEIDALEFREREFIGRAKGKVLFIQGDKLGGGVDVEELIENLSAIGVHVTTATGEEGDDKRPPVSAEDLSLDSAGVMTLWTMIKEKKKYMEELSGWSEIAAGQQTQYVGQRVQDQSISQTNLALSGIVDGFVRWMEDQMQYGCDVQKLIPNCWRIERAIGEAGIAFLEMDKGMPFSRNQIVLKVNDKISAANRAELMQFTVARAATGDQTAVLDFAQMQKLPTWTLVSDYLEHAIKRDQAAAEKAQLQQEARAASVQAAALDATNNGQIAMEDARQETAKQIAEGKSKTQLAGDAMKQEGVSPEQAMQLVS